MAIDASSIWPLPREPECRRFLRQSRPLTRFECPPRVLSRVRLSSSRDMAPKDCAILTESSPSQYRTDPRDSEQAQLARSAFSLFGKGRHRAGLNYGSFVTLIGGRNPAISYAGPSAD